MTKEADEEFGEIVDSLRDQGIEVITDKPDRYLEWCLCCNRRGVFAGRLVLGHIPICSDCEGKCSPRQPKCEINPEGGKKYTLDEWLELPDGVPLYKR